MSLDQELIARAERWFKQFDDSMVGSQPEAEALIRDLLAAIGTLPQQEQTGFCEAHQPPHSACACCEAVHADDLRKEAEAKLAAAQSIEDPILAHLNDE